MQFLFQVGAVVQYECKKRYPVVVSGDPQMVCTKKGNWKGRPLECGRKFPGEPLSSL